MHKKKIRKIAKIIGVTGAGMSSEYLLEMIRKISDDIERDKENG